MKEASDQGWSVRTLSRNISTQYYERLLLSQHKEPVEEEMKELTAPYQADKLEFIKNPVVAEFLGLESNIDFTETDLEQSIIPPSEISDGNGKGICFCCKAAAYPHPLH